MQINGPLKCLYEQRHLQQLRSSVLISKQVSCLGRALWWWAIGMAALSCTPCMPTHRETASARARQQRVCVRSCRDAQVQRAAFELVAQLPGALLASIMAPEGEWQLMGS